MGKDAQHCATDRENRVDHAKRKDSIIDAVCRVRTFQFGLNGRSDLCGYAEQKSRKMHIFQAFATKQPVQI
ncbi:MAG: hypothetical protein CMO10_11765 [Thalassospira sp.]|nr:hypothetical protein [Thalassospira sp.]